MLRFPRFRDGQPLFVTLHKLIHAVHKIVKSSFLMARTNIGAVRILGALDEFIAPETVITGDIPPKHVIHTPAVLADAEPGALVVVRQVAGYIILIGADIYSARPGAV